MEMEKNEKYMRITPDEDYSKLSQEEVKGRLAFPNEANTSEEPDKLLAQLKKVERTSKLALVIMARSCWN